MDNIQFDPFGRGEKPYMVLCNPNGEELYSLENSFGTSNTVRFNALSELTFKFPMSIDNGGTISDAYELLKNKRLIFLENSGYYVISNVKEDLDGASPVKTVTCQSIDGELINKKLLVFSYTSIKFYDIIDPTDTLLDKIIQYIPSWTIGDVDIELTTKYRSFDVSDSTIYSFLMTDVEEAFECVFIFDYETKTISVKTVDTATTETDIFLSFDNLITNATFEENSDELTTVLYVYGGDGLDIRGVNPLGTNTIYDFSYYKTPEWMSAGLISALTNWENLVLANQTPYANNLAILRQAYDDKYSFESEMSVLEIELSAQETLLATAVQTNQSTTAILSEIYVLNSSISDKQGDIDGQQSIIDAQISYLSNINDVLSFDINFTESQYAELSRYFYENTYQNENIIRLDSMTPAVLQDQAQDLYDQGVGVLDKLSQPRYEFSLDSINFLGIEEYSQFIGELELGCVVNAELKDGTVIEAVLLELDLDYDDPSNFSMTFGNRLRLDGELFVYSDLMGAVNKTGTSVNFNSETWSNWDKYHKDDVSTFIVSALDASTNKVINASDQTFQIDQTGLRGRKVSGSTFDDKQVWVTNNVMAFTDDGWATSSLAIGEITLPSGGMGYGIIGDAIFGTIIAGNNLAITSEDTSFTLDQNGAVLSNASFTVTKGTTSIKLNPSDGIRITKDGVDTFYVDTSGNLKAGGFTVNATQIYKDGTHYLDSSTNTLKWGNLSVVGSTATFTGSIVATNLTGTLDWNNITNVPANTIAYGGGSGYLSGSGIYGGTIKDVIISNDSGSATMRILPTGAFQLVSANGEIYSSTGGFGWGGGLTSMTSNDAIILQATNWIDFRTSSLTWYSSPLATQSWVSTHYSSIGHTHSQYYESGDSPSFYNVTLTNDINLGAIASGLGSVNSPSSMYFYDYYGNRKVITVRAGIVTAMGSA